MKLYDELVLRVKSNKKCDLGDLIVIMKITAGTKNPYYIEFPKTDKNGFAILKKEELIGQFEDHLEMGLMDYNGTIESAKNTVEISLVDTDKLMKNKKEFLTWPLLTHEKKIWKTRKEELEYRLSSRNHIFVGNAIKVNLAHSNKIIFNIYAVQ
ncbi:MAG: hypothetical protein AB1439_02415 [candidate division FCPU426 bacterium]